MKIGILTFHRAHNYGAVLQCYALQQTFLKLGAHNVEVIDYRQSYIEQNYAVFSIIHFLRKARSFRSVFAYIYDMGHRRKRKNLFEDFCKENLKLSVSCDANHIPQDYDAYVIGSDQVWATNVVGGVDCVYWGNFNTLRNNVKLTYAISTNIKALEGIGIDNLKKMTLNFKSLSFREKTIVEKVSTIVERQCRQDVDPVLLTTADDWDGIIDEKWKERKYILVYQIGSPENNKDIVLNLAKEMAKIESLEVIDVTPKQVSPVDFVSLFKYAQMVLTTSFHGTAFSLLFNRPFYTISVNDKIDERAHNLLTTLGISEREKKYFETLNEKAINYIEVNQRLQEIKKDSFNYLKTIVNEGVNNSK